jgi:phosphoenolpyruvate carboxylase
MNTASSLIAFQTMVDLVETILLKSEPAIAKHYEALLVKEDMPKELGAEVHSIHLAILDLTEHEKLNENKLMLTRLLFIYSQSLCRLLESFISRGRYFEDIR